MKKLLIVTILTLFCSSAITVSAQEKVNNQNMQVGKNYYTSSFWPVDGFAFSRLHNSEDLYPETYYTANGEVHLQTDVLGIDKCTANGVAEPRQNIYCEKYNLNYEGYKTRGRWNEIITQPNNGWVYAYVE